MFIQNIDSSSIASPENTLLTLANIKDVLLLFFAFFGTLIAWLGLSTWRKQLHGNSEYDLSRRLLKAVYDVRDKINVVRNPFVWSGEIEHSLKENNILIKPEDPKYDAITTRAVYSFREAKLNNSLSELRVEMLEAEVLWGDRIKEEFKDFYDCITKLKVAVSQHLSIKEGDMKLKGDDLIQKEYIIYNTSDDPQENEFSGQIQSAVLKIENFIRPKLKL